VPEGPLHGSCHRVLVEQIRGFAVQPADTGLNDTPGVGPLHSGAVFSTDVRPGTVFVRCAVYLPVSRLQVVVSSSLLPLIGYTQDPGAHNRYVIFD
jgi:hypothetical protein